jgi:Lrp/AsnC family transcriptional regulator for asnA, asnC and gidA
MTNKNDVDDIDLEIIELLMEDGRMPCSQMANRIGGITERAVRIRLANLIERKLVKVTAIPDLFRIGIPIVADVFVDTEPGRVYEIANKLVQEDCTSYVGIATGASDISLEVVGTNIAEVYRYVHNEIGHMPGVKKVVISIVPEILKYYGYRPKAILMKKSNGDSHDIG